MLELNIELTKKEVSALNRASKKSILDNFSINNGCVIVFGENMLYLDLGLPQGINGCYELIDDWGMIEISNQNKIKVNGFTLEKEVEEKPFGYNFGKEICSFFFDYDFGFMRVKDELRLAMTGIYIDTIGGAIATTDGHRLNKTFIDKNEKVKPFIIKGILNKCHVSLFEAEDYNLRIIKETVDRLSYVYYEIDERFPDYNNVIPTHFKGSLEINLTETISFIKSIPKTVNKSTGRIRFKDHTIDIEDFDFKYKKESSSNVFVRDGEPCEFGLNKNLLLPILEAYKKRGLSSVKLLCSEPNKAMLMKIGDLMNPEEISLIMPVMLNNYI